MLAAIDKGKVSVVAGITKDHTNHMKAGELVSMIATQIGGKGGGRPDLAEAGGNKPENIEKALQLVEAWVKEKILKNT